MRPRLTTLSGIVATMLLISLGCAAPTGSDSSDPATDAEWGIDGLTLGPDSLNYAEVSGTVTMLDQYAGFGTTAEVRYYSDDYETLIVSTERTIGGDLQEVGETQAFEITHYEVYVQPATGGYERVCAEFRADDSEAEDWTEVGCYPR